jgi:hypothetical protein
MSDPASTDVIRFARSPAFREKIRYISADPRCKNVWRLSTGVPSYFLHYKSFSSFLDTETIRVISCILFHKSVYFPSIRGTNFKGCLLCVRDLSAGIRYIIGEIPVERLWLLGRAIDAVQAIKCRMPDWPAAAPALLTLADHQHELVGLGDRRAQHFDYVMWYTKAALVLANDDLPANEQLDWNRPEYALSLYLYLKKEQGVCVRPFNALLFLGAIELTIRQLCAHREGLSHASCCATLFKLYSLPIEALMDANASLFGEANPNARPRSELGGLMGKLEACGSPFLPPTVARDTYGASVHLQQIPNAPKAFRFGTLLDRLPSTPGRTTTLASPTNTKSATAHTPPSKQLPNGPRALVNRCPAPPSQPGSLPTPHHGQNTAAPSIGGPSGPSDDHKNWSTFTPTRPTTPHPLVPRPPTLEPPPRRYYGRSGVYVGRQPTYPLFEAIGGPASNITNTREHTQTSYPPLNQYVMQHNPIYQPGGLPPTQSSASVVIATNGRLTGGVRKQELTHAHIRLAQNSTFVRNGSLSSSIVTRAANATTSDNNGEQLSRVEKRVGGDGREVVHLHDRPMSSDANVVEVRVKSPESGEADMEVDELDEHLGTIQVLAEDHPKRAASEVGNNQDLQPDKDSSGGGSLTKVTSTIDVGSDGSTTQAEQQTPIRCLGSVMEESAVTPPAFDGVSAGANSVEKTAAQVLPRGDDQKPSDHTNGGGDASQVEFWYPVAENRGSISSWISSTTGKVSSLPRDEPLSGHRRQRSEVGRQLGSMVNETAVALDLGEIGTSDGHRLSNSEESAELVAGGNLQGLVGGITQTGASPKTPPHELGNKEPETTTQPTPPTGIKEIALLSSSPAKSPTRRATRTSMGRLWKRNYAESSDDERPRVNRSNSGSRSKGAGGQTAKRKRSDVVVNTHLGTTRTQTPRPVPNDDKPLVMGADPASTSGWEVQLRRMPNELEMWKERDLFRCSTTGITPASRFPTC